jgi:hypothetical protein
MAYIASISLRVSFPDAALRPRRTILHGQRRATLAVRMAAAAAAAILGLQAARVRLLQMLVGAGPPAERVAVSGGAVLVPDEDLAPKSEEAVARQEHSTYLAPFRRREAFREQPFRPARRHIPARTGLHDTVDRDDFGFRQFSAPKSWRRS